MNESGLANFISWDGDSKTLTEFGLSVIPGFNKFYKISDFGYKERQEEGMAADRRAAAAAKMALPPEVRSALGEYYRLDSLKDKRSDEQTAKYFALRDWYNKMYRPKAEAIHELDAAGDKAAAETMRRELGELTTGAIPRNEK